VSTAGGETVAGLRERLAALEVENEHLRIGLASRIVIEQAKGVLIERLDLPPEEVFGLMRTAARRSRMKIHMVAAEILKTRVTPDYLAREIQHLVRGNTTASNSET
jgi:AmiR/NasT family two-component response regulator